MKIVFYQLRGIHRTPLDPRFLFDEKYIPEPNSGCWLWTGATHPKGYPRMTARGVTFPATRFSLQMHTGESGDGFQCCHRCDNPYCVNPEHLFWGTRSDNQQDALKKGRPNSSRLPKTHCKRGHAFTPENTKIVRHVDGHVFKHCIMCRRLWEREKYHADLVKSRARLKTKRELRRITAEQEAGQ